jgi:carboxyl-terminal processing protease
LFRFQEVINMKSRLRTKRLKELVFVVALCIVWFLIGWITRGWLQPSDSLLIEQARQMLKDSYPAEAPEDRELNYAAIRGMLERIEDPYAELMEPVVGQAYLSNVAGTLGIVGIHPVKRDSQIIADRVVPGQAADRAGLKSGDIILSVDGVSFDEDMTEAQAAMLHMAGPVGTTAHFVVERGHEVMSFDVVRQSNTLVTSRMLDDQIGYLFLSAFTQDAPQKVRAALQDLLKHNPKALIWDLRDNRGGSILAAQQIMSYFIKDGLLFTAELKGPTEKPFVAQVVNCYESSSRRIINDQTASAAEAAAAAIQERRRGTLVGAQTHGKSEIQTTLPLGDGSLLHFSIGKLLSPAGQWYQDRGVTPDMLANDVRDAQSDQVLETAVDYIRRNLKQ